VPELDVAVDWAGFDRDGVVRLGRLSADFVQQLQARIDAIMLGEAALDYDRLMMQLDPGTGNTADLGEQTLGFKGPTLNYRKIEGLEADPLFRSLVQLPIAAQICRRMYGAGVPIATFRCMFMNKPAGQGTPLTWHQDRWIWLDRDPLVTFYVALDAATEATGCVHVVEGSHHTLVNPQDDSGFLEPSHYAAHCPPERDVALELAAGEVALLHNWLIHSSGVNHTDAPRRAFSVCYMDAGTVDYLGQPHPVVFDANGQPAQSACQ
jgi:hypothetical protein